MSSQRRDAHPPPVALAVRQPVAPLRRPHRALRSGVHGSSAHLCASARNAGPCVATITALRITTSRTTEYLSSPRLVTTVCSASTTRTRLTSFARCFLSARSARRGPEGDGLGEGYGDAARERYDRSDSPALLVGGLYPRAGSGLQSDRCERLP